MADHPMPRVSCPRGGDPRIQIGGCFNHALNVTIAHWAPPMLVGALLLAGVVLAFVLATRYAVHGED